MADIDWSRIFLPAGMPILSTAWFGMTSVFLMRANGLYAHYFLDRLDLETMTKEIVYVPKAHTLRELETDATMSWGKVVFGMLVGYSLGLTLGGSLGMTFLTGFMQGAVYGIGIAGALGAVAGISWAAYAVATKKSVKWGVIKFPIALFFCSLIYAAIGLVLFTQMDFRTGPKG